MGFSTKVQEASQILQMLQNLEQAIRSVELEQAGLDQSDDATAMIREGDIITYGERKEELRTQIKRVESQSVEYASLIDSLRDIREKQELAELGITADD